MKRLSERLAGHSSRRGFFATMTKVALGAAAIVTGQGIFAQGAQAASLHCCEGIACAHGHCTGGTYIGYTWSCGHYFCHDCFAGGGYLCTYTVYRGGGGYHTTRAASHPVSNRSSGYAPYGYGPYGYGPYGPPPGYFDYYGY
jgi:hypothetical protein